MEEHELTFVDLSFDRQPVNHAEAHVTSGVDWKVLHDLGHVVPSCGKLFEKSL